mmetsp:Transcript_13083/g.22070  ORF Transcript_13083/g.22070 Transcript_13083/m.22070 type:complete len:132 (+) Transcript_13083:563-958(+)
MTKDDLEYYRKIAMDSIALLLAHTVEMNDLLVGVLVNKLGDSSKKVQLHAVTCLCKLLRDNQRLAPMAIHEANLFLQRAGIKPQQKYCAVQFLNRVGAICGQGSDSVRMILFRVYFSMFKGILQNPIERKE